MKYLTLNGTDIYTSSLGFGCASIMGRQGKRKSLNALSCAYDNGIIHYDVARSYGFGEAEKVVGKFIRNKRDKICLATKFGILPTNVNPFIRYAKPIVRTLIEAIPSLRHQVRRSGQHFINAGNFSVQTARNSLHDSLSALGVETIDLLLLHECNINTPLSDELFEFLDRCISTGKIRSYGVATDPSSANNLFNRYPVNNLTITQTPLIPEHEYSKLENNTRIKTRIVHSVIKLSPILKSRLNQSIIENSLTHADISDMFRSSDTVSHLLRYASHKTHGGVTLMSSFTPEHIIQNAHAMETFISEDMIQILDNLFYNQ